MLTPRSWVRRFRLRCRLRGRGGDRKLGRHSHDRDDLYGLAWPWLGAYLVSVLRLFGWKFLFLWANA